MNKELNPHVQKEQDLYSLYLKAKLKEAPVTKEKYKETLVTVKQLFDIFKNVYGKGWYDNFASNEAFDLWTVNLLEFDLSIVAKAVDYCINNKIRRLDIIEFKSICKNMKNEDNKPFIPVINKKKGH